jgi:hypothetical protein
MNNFISQIRDRGALALLIACLLLAGPGTALYAQNKVSDINDPAAGKGMIVAGELWDSYMPLNKGPFYSEATLDLFKVVRIGNFDRQWSSPTHMWPGGGTPPSGTKRGIHGLGSDDVQSGEHRRCKPVAFRRSGTTFAFWLPQQARSRPLPAGDSA